MSLKSLVDWCVSKSIPIALLLFTVFLYTRTAYAQSSSDFSSASAWQANGSLAQLSDGGIPESAGSPGVINPYFANEGALGWLRDPARIPSVLKYIQWYINRINPSGTPDVWGYTGGGTMYNYTYSNGATGGCQQVSGQCTADSTDAYAGTFLTLLWAAWNTGDSATRQYLTNNQAAIDEIGQVILATSSSNSDGLSYATPTYAIKFLMDNCEDWDGLNSLAQLFAALGNSRASVYQNAANAMQSGILSMWMGSSWSVYRDGPSSSNDHAPVWQYWYPDASAQMFPVAHHVVPPSDSRAQAAYSSVINSSQWASWYNLPWNSCGACDRTNYLNDGSGAGPDPFPWTIFADGMSLQGDSHVSTYVSNIENIYVKANPPYEPPPGTQGSGDWRTQENGWWMIMGSSSGTGNGSSGQIAGVDDSVNTNWNAQVFNGAYFGVANITESSQPYTYTTDGHSIRFDVGCSGSSCSYGLAHIYNASYGTTPATDAANSITNDLMATMDSVGVSNSQAIVFGIDQSMCTANCGTGSDRYTRFRYAMQCDFKGSGLWRVWDANSQWVATNRGCAPFSPALSFNHFTFHLARPDASHVQYVDFVINGVTYPLNMTQAAQSLGTTATHEFIPWVDLDGDSATDGYSLWVDQWTVSYSGPGSGGTGGGGGGLIPTPPSNAVAFPNMDNDPISSDPTNPPIGQWGQCTTSDCGSPANQTSFTDSGTSLDGQALDAFNSGGAYWGVLYYHKNGQQNFATNYEVQWKFMTDTAWSNVQALEFDFPVSIGQQFFYFGTQCDRISGQWQYWNPNSGTGLHGWHNSGIACNGFSPNQWHTLVWYGTRTSSSFTYNALEVDGQQTAVNITIAATPCCNGWSDEFIVQFQPDGDSAGTGYNLYVDEVDAWIW